MKNNFQGFPKELFLFFEALSQNNTKDWFSENKPKYEQFVVAPMLEFIEQIGPRLNGISPYFEAIPKKSGGSMFRIYRDVRFAKDKTPYKEHAACQFRHEAGKDAHAPGFYVHLAPETIKVGGGIWLPPSDKLLMIRQRIVDKPKEWSAVIEDEGIKRYFGGVAGESLKRPPRGFKEDSSHIIDLKRKSFFLMREFPATAACHETFIDEVAETFETATPLMAFLCAAAGVSY